MAKTKYDDERTAVLVRGYAMEGCTNEEIAKRLGIHVATLQRWANEHRDICEALKEGKEVVDYQVEQTLLRKALSGDTVAMIFWMKNRMPGKWKDRPQEDTSSTGRKVDDLISIASELSKGIVDVHD